MSDPRISVVVPNYSHAQYLPRSTRALFNPPVLLGVRLGWKRTKPVSAESGSSRS